MAGYAKEEEQTKVEDSNMFMTGSDEDKAFRKKIAALEPAWEDAGKAAGIQVWRIEHFKVVAVPEENYGKFHKGDSYIVFQTIEGANGNNSHNIFFWIGGETSCDEQGTAAYKTVELDDFFGTEPTQHREAMNEESSDFLQLFGGSIELLDGGIDSGFKHVPPPDKHEVKMYQVRRHKGKVTENRCPLKTDVLHPHDVFVLDAENAIYLFGMDQPGMSPFVTNHANSFAENLEQAHASGAKVTRDIDDGFWAALEGTKPDWV